jgi:hypothetical protein
MKIPEPIIEPATSIVASVSVSALTNSRDDVAVPAVVVVVVNALPDCPVYVPLGLLLCGRKVRAKGGFFQ